MTCKEAKKLIALCYYGELDAAESEAMRGHLESCESCRAEFAAVRKTLSGITPPSVPEMPEEFWRANAARIMKEVASPRAARSRPVWMWYAAAAAAVVLCLLGLSILLRSGREPESDGMIVIPNRREPLWEETPRERPERAAVPDIPLDDPVLAEVETDIEMESIETGLTDFWNAATETENGFNAEFEKTLNSIESSIDELMLELDLT
jgi:hypothetical protein